MIPDCVLTRGSCAAKISATSFGSSTKSFNFIPPFPPEKRELIPLIIPPLIVDKAVLTTEEVADEPLEEREEVREEPIVLVMVDPNIPPSG
jgi:hypothetical protein